MKRFEVRRGKQVMACTEHEQCVPSKERRAELRKAGYKLYMDGKVWNERK